MQARTPCRRMQRQYWPGVAASAATRPAPTDIPESGACSPARPVSDDRPPWHPNTVAALSVSTPGRTVRPMQLLHRLVRLTGQALGVANRIPPNLCHRQPAGTANGRLGASATERGARVRVAITRPAFGPTAVTWTPSDGAAYESAPR